MPKVMIDPVKQAEQFKADLAAMRVGPKDAPPGPVRQRLLAKNFALNFAGFRRSEWYAELEEHHTFADAADPAFWSNVVDQLIRTRNKGIGDKIVIYKPDSRAVCDLQVDETGKGYIRTSPWGRSIAEAKAPEDSPLTTRWNVGLQRHQVVRADGVVMQADGFQTKEAALAWIADHLAKMAA